MLNGINSKYMLREIFGYVNYFKYLEIIRHNKSIQNILNLNIKDYELAYKQYNQIEIEILSEKMRFNNYINYNMKKIKIFILRK